jgi:anti-anti-sigma regulatory factor
MRRRTQLSIDLPARYVFVIGVEGRLDAVSGVRLLRLLDTRLTLTSAAAPPTRRVLIDLTGLDGADSGGIRSLDRARRAAEHHGVTLALIIDEELWAHVPSGDRHYLGSIAAFRTVGDALQNQTNALIPVIARPTISDWIESVPS